MATGEATLSRRRFIAAFAGLLLAHTAILAVLAWATPWTTDEPNYLQAGQALAEHFEFEAYATILHGPLPFLANQLAHPLAPPQALTDDFHYKFWGRLGLLPFSLLAALFLGLWTRAALGRRAALLAVGLFAINPIALGHGCLMTADMALTAFYVLAGWATWSYLRAPSVARVAAVGAAIGLGLATKYLALFLIPALGIAATIACLRGVRPGLLWSRGEDAGAWRRLADLLPAGAICAVVASLVLHTCYLWSVPGYYSRTPAASDQPVNPQGHDVSPLSETFKGLLDKPGGAAVLGLLPDPWARGVDYQKYYSEQGSGVSYFGDEIATGFPAYFATALAVKLPLGFLLLLALGLLVRGPPRTGNLAGVLLWSIAVPLVYLSCFTALQIGVRYVLPIVPLLCMIAARPIEVAGLRRGLGAALLVALVGWQVVDAALAWPRYVQWFNPTASERPYLLFKDSNLDWRAEQYGDRDGEAIAKRHPQSQEVFALSGPRLGKVHIYGVDLAPQDPRDQWRIYHWLRRFQPIDRVGAWFAFDITEASFRAAVGDDARGRAELATALLGAGRGTDAVALLEANPDPNADAIRRAIELQARAPADPAYAQLLSDLGRFDLILARAEDYPPHLVAHALFCRGQRGAAIQRLTDLERERPLLLPEAALLASALREYGEPEQATEVLERYQPAEGQPYHEEWKQLRERHRQQTEAMRLVERKGQRR